MNSVPAGWPRSVPPAGTPGWEQAAVEWLLDHCPADYRGYRGWRRRPVVLAWLAQRHLQAQLVAMREAWRDIRPELGEQVEPEALTEVLAHLQTEGLRLRAAAHAARLVKDALEGKEHVPRL